jgi:hypothetical protein
MFENFSRQSTASHKIEIPPIEFMFNDTVSCSDYTASYMNWKGYGRKQGVGMA